MMARYVVLKNLSIAAAVRHMHSASIRLGSSLGIAGLESCCFVRRGSATGSSLCSRQAKPAGEAEPALGGRPILHRCYAC